MEIQNNINKKLKEVKDYLDKIGEGVEHFEYSIKYEFNQWNVFIEGTSVDGEEQTYEIKSDWIDKLLDAVKEEF